MGVLRVDWAQLEPREGEFDWSQIDRFLEAWAKIGKVVNLGVMCANTHTTNPLGYATPDWVFAAGAKYTEVNLVT